MAIQGNSPERSPDGHLAGGCRCQFLAMSRTGQRVAAGMLHLHPQHTVSTPGLPDDPQFHAVEGMAATLNSHPLRRTCANMIGFTVSWIALTTGSPAPHFHLALAAGRPSHPQLRTWRGPPRQPAGCQSAGLRLSLRARQPATVETRTAARARYAPRHLREPPRRHAPAALPQVDRLARRLLKKRDPTARPRNHSPALHGSVTPTPTVRLGAPES